MYDLAFQFRNAGLWEILNNTEMFAVRLPGGEIGYCSVMGKLENHFALAVYVGDAGYQSYRLLLDTDADEVDTLKMINMMAEENCLVCSYESGEHLTQEDAVKVRIYAAAHDISLHGENAYPQFKKHVTGRVPWRLRSKEDEERISEGLLAALEMHRMLSECSRDEIGLHSVLQEPAAIPLLSRKGDGWKLQTIPLPPAKMQYPQVEFTDQLLAMRLKKQKTADVWECMACWTIFSMKDDPTGLKAPYRPLVLAAMNLETHRIIPLLRNGEELSEMVHEFAQQLLKSGKVPGIIRCVDDRSFAMLMDLGEKTGISIERTDEMQMIGDGVRQFMELMGEKFEDSDADDGEHEDTDEDDAYDEYEDEYPYEDDEESPDDDEGTYHPEEHIADLVCAIGEMTDDELKQMPRELKDMLRDLVDMGLLRDETARRIRNVLRGKR